MTACVLTGPDGSTPLGFLCALGLLDVVTARAAPGDAPRLSWTTDGRWNPVLHGVASLDAVCDAVLEDSLTWGDDSFLGWSYGDGVRDLKPPPDLARTWLRRAAKSDRRHADIACGLVGDVAVDNKGAAKPGALHFTAGQQLFLATARDLRDSLTRERVSSTLCGPWIGDASVKSLNWGNEVTRRSSARWLVNGWHCSPWDCSRRFRGELGCTRPGSRVAI